MSSRNNEVFVKMRNLENGVEFIWTKDKFLNRLYLMKEMYQKFEEEEDDLDDFNFDNPREQADEHS